MSKNSKAHKRGSSRNKRDNVRKSRRGNRSRRSNRTRRTNRHRGGVAPVTYSLAGSWPSRMSLGQGEDYFKYHKGQHGGMGYDSNMGGAPLKAIVHSTLPENLRMAAHVGGIDKAIADVRPLKDPNQMGGRRRSKRRGSKRHGKKRGGAKRKCWGMSRRKSNKNRRTRRRGGSMGYAPFPNKGMLLDSSREYAQAGLNPQWKTDVAFDLAKVRATQ